MLLLLLHLARAVAAGTYDEAAALVAFKLASVTADPAGRLASWGEPDSTSGSGSPCEWTGVSCADGRVRALNLRGPPSAACGPPRRLPLGLSEASASDGMPILTRLDAFPVHQRLPQDAEWTASEDLCPLH